MDWIRCSHPSKNRLALFGAPIDDAWFLAMNDAERRNSVIGRRSGSARRADRYGTERMRRKPSQPPGPARLWQTTFQAERGRCWRRRRRFPIRRGRARQELERLGRLEIAVRNDVVRVTGATKNADRASRTARLEAVAGGDHAGAIGAIAKCAALARSRLLQVIRADPTSSMLFIGGRACRRK